MRHIYVAILLIALIGSVAGCHRQPSTDPRIAQVEEILNRIDPPADSALNMLDCIAEPLSSRDRALKAMLTVKANDKAYLPLTSDSLILTALDYFEHHPSDSLALAESLYYGGRVSVSMGDYPAALAYFRRALDHLPASPSTLRLRGIILAQTAAVLNKLRLNKEAIPILKEALDISHITGDRKGEVLTLHDLGFTLCIEHSYEEAEYYFKRALEAAQNFSPHYRARARMDIAGVKQRLGQIDSALYYIRGTIDSIKFSSKNLALATAAEIYRDAQIRDTAYIYAKRLVETDDTRNHQIGYGILLLPEYRQYSSPDTLLRYISDFSDLCETRLNNHDLDFIANHDNYYSYRLGRERYESQFTSMLQSSKRKIIVYAIMAIVVLSCVGFFTHALLIKRHRKDISESSDAIHRNKAPLLELKQLETICQTLESLSAKIDTSLTEPHERNNIELAEISVQLSQIQNGIKELNETATSQPNYILDHNTSETRRQLLDEIEKRIGETLGQNLNDDSARFLSMREKLENLLSDERTLHANDPLWDEIEKTISSHSSSFKRNLIILTNNQMTQSEYEFALLFKLGLRIKDIAALLSIEASSIQSRKNSLINKILNGTNHKIKINHLIKVL